MGFGAYFYNDVTGPTSRTGLTGTYAYNIALKYGIRLSFGINFGLMQYKVDGTQLSAKDLTDLAIQPFVTSTYVPDATFGTYLYTDYYYVGLSIGQLFNNKLKLWEEKNGLNKLKSHFYLTGGYKYQLNKDFLIEPSIIIKGTAPKAFSFDISSRIIYKNSFWGGLSFRLHDAVSILVGYLYDEKFAFGYSYDIGITSLRKYNSGSHEIMLGYRFGKIR
jgi:type IX secretion system PorP/SprF family membrane protein